MQRWLEDLLNDQVQGELEQAERMSLLKQMTRSDPNEAMVSPGGQNGAQGNGVLVDGNEEERVVLTPTLPTPPRSAVPPISIESPDSHLSARVIDGVSISCRVAEGASAKLCCFFLKHEAALLLLKNCMIF